MKDNKSIAEQVAELTEEQQNKLMKVGFWGTIIMCAVLIPLIVLVLLGLFIMISDPMKMEGAAYYGFLILCAITAILAIGGIFVIKSICPYYNDRKYVYIKKMRKQK